MVNHLAAIVNKDEARRMAREMLTRQMALGMIDLAAQSPVAARAILSTSTATRKVRPAGSTRRRVPRVVSAPSWQLPVRGSRPAAVKPTPTWRI